MEEDASGQLLQDPGVVAGKQPGPAFGPALCPSLLAPRSGHAKQSVAEEKHILAALPQATSGPPLGHQGRKQPHCLLVTQVASVPQEEFPPPAPSSFPRSPSALSSGMRLEKSASGDFSTEAGGGSAKGHQAETLGRGQSRGHRPLWVGPLGPQDSQLLFQAIYEAGLIRTVGKHGAVRAPLDHPPQAEPGSPGWAAERG